MKNRMIDNIKLGGFVIGGMIFLIFSLYMIGSNRNLFGSTFTIKTYFHNINGLMVGNNVRYSGIDVGTVKKIEIVNDSTVSVTMLIENDVRKFIKQNAITSVGTDGLMGNKLVNINSVPEAADPVEEGMVLKSLRPVETDEMLRTLNTTNENIAGITDDLQKITQRIKNSKGIWGLLQDTSIARNMEAFASNLNLASKKVVLASDELAILVHRVNQGNGVAGALLTDTTLTRKIKSAVAHIEDASAKTAQISRDISEVMKQMKKGQGAAGAIFTDSTTDRNLRQSITNIEQGTAKFNENMEALKHHFLFRGYFKDQEKQAEKDKAQKGKTEPQPKKP
ncbi:MAG: MCE family protein [Bacteroidetes bacterium]|nr:MCE family protein [Bacteroidota bacterium]